MAGRIAYLGNIVTQGLILDLDAAKRESYPGTGTSWNDLSVNASKGILTNGPTFSSADYGSIAFDGVDDYANIPDNSDLRLNGNFTISLWHRAITMVNTYPGPLYKGNSGPAGTGYIMFYTSISNGDMYFKRQNQTFTLTSATSTSWKHITFTYDGTNVRGYLNGVLGATFSGITFPTNTDTSALQLGRADNFGNGAVGNLTMYNRALSQTEITQNFNAYRSRYGI